MNINYSPSFGKPNHNLPIYTTGFVGRKRELDDLARLFSNPTVRLITLLAPGGMGKTRLAVALAKQQFDKYQDGVYFISLAPLKSIDSIMPTVASAIGLSFRPGTDMHTQLLDYLRSCEMLLIFDNYEHLLDGADLIATILEAAPLIKVIITSRERLHLSCETTYLIGGMDLPNRHPTSEVDISSAAQLFIQSAKQLRPNWQVKTEDLRYITRLSYLTGGMPLAIILAATWFNLLSLAEIADEVAHNLDFLRANMQDLPDRFQSIRAVFEGTWKHLSEQEQQIFVRLSIFRGGCSLDAAVEVTDANLETLHGLIDKALIIRNENGRYEIHELLRQYGKERLKETPQEYHRLRNRHCDYYANFTLQMYEGHHAAETKMWLALMDNELENLQDGWHWAIQHVNREALWQYSKLYLFYALRCRFEEGETILAQSVSALEAHRPNNQPDILLARLLAFHVFLCHYTLQIDKMEISHRKSLDIVLQVDDLGKDRETVAILYFLGSSLHFIHPQEASDLLEKCIEYCRIYNHRDALMVAALMNLLSFIPWLGQNQTRVEEGLQLAQQLNYLRGMATFSQYQAMLAYWGKEDVVTAKRWLNQSIDLHRKSDDPLNLAGALVTLGDIAIHSGDLPTAKDSLLEALNLFDNNGCLPWILSPTLVCVARLLFATDNKQGSAQLCACIQQAPFLNQPTIHPIYIIKNPDPTALWVKLKNDLSAPTLTLSVESGRTLDMTSAIKTALTLLEQIAFQNHAPLPMTDLKSLNMKLSDHLTPKEFEVFQYILAGYSNPDIAKKLVISKNTLKTHISRLYNKLSVKNRSQAILRGRELELLK